MCGIIFSFPHPSEFNSQDNRVRHAMTMMRHRGPDEGNYQKLLNAYIAHQRLSIVDLLGSHQPMNDFSERYHLSFNGEIYNYKELRKQLEPFWKFNTTGDTEVALAGLVLEGHDFVKKMEGMWAIALWDVEEQLLFLSRDRLGKKPLYYSHTKFDKKVFHCASELPILLSLLSKRPEEDERSRIDYLKYGIFLPGTTIYKDIFEVLPGYNLIFKNGNISTNQYWQLNPAESGCNKSEVYEQLDELLKAAVKKRLVADVEVGAFLSGGIDSSLVVAFAQQSMAKKLKTFSIGFQEQSYDETLYAQQIADLYQTDHHKEILSLTDYNSLSELTINNIGQPFADSSLLPTRLVSRLASKHVKIVLTGDGADELFSGYQRYTSRTILRWYNKLPPVIKKNLQKVIGAIPEPHKHHSASLIKKTHLFSRIANRIESETPYIAPVYLSKMDVDILLPGAWSNGHQIPDELEETKLDDISRMMYADALVYLPQDILLKVDRASMASSLETRSPFLDHKIVELAFSVPLKWHRNMFTGKQMLKNVFQNQLPANIWTRRKQGFGAPQSVWFRQQLGDSLLQLLAEVDSPMNHDYIRELLKNHRLGMRDYGAQLWLFYSYFLWKKLML